MYSGPLYFHFLPSEICRMVLDYLCRIKCLKTADALLNECQLLSELRDQYVCVTDLPVHFTYPTTLLDILKDYLRIVNSIACRVANLRLGHASTEIENLLATSYSQSSYSTDQPTASSCLSPGWCKEQRRSSLADSEGNNAHKISPVKQCNLSHHRTTCSSISETVSLNTKPTPYIDSPTPTALDQRSTASTPFLTSREGEHRLEPSPSSLVVEQPQTDCITTSLNPTSVSQRCFGSSLTHLSTPTVTTTSVHHQPIVECPASSLPTTTNCDSTLTWSTPFGPVTWTTASAFSILPHLPPPSFAADSPVTTTIASPLDTPSARMTVGEGKSTQQEDDNSTTALTSSGRRRRKRTHSPQALRTDKRLSVETDVSCTNESDQDIDRFLTTLFSNVDQVANTLTAKITKSSCHQQSHSDPLPMSSSIHSSHQPPSTITKSSTCPPSILPESSTSTLATVEVNSTHQLRPYEPAMLDSYHHRRYHYQERSAASQRPTTRDASGDRHHYHQEHPRPVACDHVPVHHPPTTAITCNTNQESTVNADTASSQIFNILEMDAYIDALLSAYEEDKDLDSAFKRLAQQSPETPAPTASITTPNTSPMRDDQMANSLSMPTARCQAIDDPDPDKSVKPSKPRRCKRTSIGRAKSPFDDPPPPTQRSVKSRGRGVKRSRPVFSSLSGRQLLPRPSCSFNTDTQLLTPLIEQLGLPQSGDRQSGSRQPLDGDNATHSHISPNSSSLPSTTPTSFASTLISPPSSQHTPCNGSSRPEPLLTSPPIRSSKRSHKRHHDSSTYNMNPGADQGIVEQSNVKTSRSLLSEKVASSNQPNNKTRLVPTSRKTKPLLTSPASLISLDLAPVAMSSPSSTLAVVSTPKPCRNAGGLSPHSLQLVESAAIASYCRANRPPVDMDVDNRHHHANSRRPILSESASSSSDKENAASQSLIAKLPTGRKVLDLSQLDVDEVLSQSR